MSVCRHSHVHVHIPVHGVHPGADVLQTQHALRDTLHGHLRLELVRHHRLGLLLLLLLLLLLKLLLLLLLQLHEFALSSILGGLDDIHDLLALRIGKSVEIHAVWQVDVVVPRQLVQHLSLHRCISTRLLLLLLLRVLHLGYRDLVWHLLGLNRKGRLELYRRLGIIVLRRSRLAVVRLR